MAKFPALDDKFPRIIPSFKQLVKIVSECVAGGVSLNCTAYEFCQCDTAMGTALANFMEVLRLKELPPERNEAINQIILIYIRMSSEMAKLETALGMDATAAAISCISNVYTLLKELENSNSDLKMAVDNSLTYSEVPVVDSLLRVGNFVLSTKGEEWEALGARLEALIPRWNEIVAGEGIPDELEQHDKALGRLVDACNNRDTSNLAEILEEIKKTGEALAHFDDSQVKDESNTVVLCPYCGKAMMSGRKKCFSCGARMPEDYERGLEPGGEDSEDPLSRDMPDYVRRIFDVGQALPENARMIRPFKRAVGELRRRVTEASSRVSKMASAKIKMSPEDREKVDSIIDLSTTCMENFTKAVELLEAFEAPVDKFHMRCALELVADAVEEMRSVGGLAKKYRRAVKT
ncbi:MAG: hypothetical protein K6A35_01100 [bacterium]|nr:hypothetical protein [bacterium]